MGCDIHLWVERRETAEAPWRLATPPAWTCSWCRGSPRPSCYWCAGSGVEGTFRSRNYALFAMLANVRNDGDYEPIAEPRGWPEDMSVGLRDHIQREEAGDADARDQHLEEQAARGIPAGQCLASPGEHSESWLTLAEVLAYFEARPSCAEDAGSSFRDGLVPACLTLGAPENVRIVFNFDS